MLLQPDLLTDHFPAIFEIMALQNQMLVDFYPGIASLGHLEKEIDTPIIVFHIFLTQTIFTPHNLLNKFLPDLMIDFLFFAVVAFFIF